MERPLLIASLFIFAASMMGCGDMIMPCTTDEDCTFDFGWDSQAASRHDWDGDIGMVCNLVHDDLETISPIAKCNEMVGWLQELMDGDWLPIPDIGELDICSWLFEGTEDLGTCEITGLPW